MSPYNRKKTTCTTSYYCNSKDAAVGGSTSCFLTTTTTTTMTKNKLLYVKTNLESSTTTTTTRAVPPVVIRRQQGGNTTTSSIPTTEMTRTNNNYKTATTMMANYQFPAPPKERSSTRSSMHELCKSTWWIVDIHGGRSHGATPLVVRCMREYGWSEMKACNVLQGYRQFLLLKSIQQDWDGHKLSPSILIDMMWHQHILDTTKYIHDCQYLCGNMIHHYPDGGNNQIEHIKRLYNTRRLLIATFHDNNNNNNNSTTTTTEAAAIIDHDVWHEVLHAGPEKDRRQQSQKRDVGVVVPSSNVVENDDHNNNEYLRIFIRDHTGKTRCYTINYSTQLYEFFNNEFATKYGIEMSHLRFIHKGRQIPIDDDYNNHNITPRSLGLVDNDQEIRIVPRLRGC